MARALLDVSLSIDTGELVVIAGASGSGKSTLVRLLLGLESPTRGWITVNGITLGGTSPAALAAHRRRIGVIPQRPILIPDLNALQNVALGLEVAGASHSVAIRSAGAMLEQLGLSQLIHRPARELSVGEQKCVTVARALARESAPLLIADEPAGDLEPAQLELVAELLHERRRKGATVIVTSQQSGLVGLPEQRVVMLDHGRITLDSEPAERAIAS